MFIYVLYNGQLKGLNIDKIFAKKALLTYFSAFLYVSKPKTIIILVVTKSGLQSSGFI